MEPSECEIVLTSGDPSERESGDQLGRAIAKDLGLHVGLTSTQEYDVNADLARLGKNGVLYACIVQPIRGLRAAFTIRFLYRGRSHHCAAGTLRSIAGAS